MRTLNCVSEDASRNEPPPQMLVFLSADACVGTETTRDRAIVCASPELDSSLARYEANFGLAVGSACLNSPACGDAYRSQKSISR